jgi:RecA-family ATPase
MELKQYLERLETMERPQFVIQDLLLPKRYLLLAGRSGIGKSLLGTQLMLSFASGKPWLDFVVKACPCLYINLELPDPQLGDRLTKQLTSYQLIYQPNIESYPFAPLHLDTTAGVEWLTGMIKTNPRSEVVIIDSFRQCYGGKLNDNDRVAKWCSNVYNLMDLYNLAIVVVQNTSKAKPFLERGSTEEAIGAVELANRAASVLVATAYQLRTSLGQFGSKAKDEVELHIPKYGCSTKELKTRYVKLNRQSLLFEVM